MKDGSRGETMEATQRRRKVEVSLDPVGRRDRQWGWYLWLTTAAEEDVRWGLARPANKGGGGA